MKIPLYLLILLTLHWLPMAASAQHQHSHVHGIATLALALEDTVLELEFESPAANLLGFEHQAKTTAEKKQIEKITSLLNLPDKLFKFDGSLCEISNILLNTENLIATEHTDNHEDNHQDNHEDNHKYSHEEHHEHLNKAHQKEKQEDSHREIAAHYRFNCANTAAIESVSTTLFEHFSSIKKVNLVWVSDSGQGAITLNATSNTVRLK